MWSSHRVTRTAWNHARGSHLSAQAIPELRALGGESARGGRGDLGGKGRLGYELEKVKVISHSRNMDMGFAVPTLSLNSCPATGPGPGWLPAAKVGEQTPPPLSTKGSFPASSERAP